MKFLFECRFNVFDLICLFICFIARQETGSYWWYLLAIPAMFVSVIMERKLERNKIIDEILNQRQRGY
jgi:hypothetical protein